MSLMCANNQQRDYNSADSIMHFLSFEAKDQLPGH